MAALLRNQGKQVVAQTELGDLCNHNILLACGSQSDNARQITESLREAGAPVFETGIDSVEKSAKRIADSLAPHPITVLRHPCEDNDSPQELTEGMASITQKALRLHPQPPPHLCLEGGETAAAVLKQLNEESFTVLHEWEPGVVTLRSESQLLATVKPGSYRWPPQLLEQDDD